MPKYQNTSEHNYGYMDVNYRNSEVKTMPYFVDPVKYPNFLMLDSEVDLFNPIIQSDSSDMSTGSSFTIDIQVDNVEYLRFCPPVLGTAYQVYLHSESNTPPFTIIGGKPTIMNIFRRADKIIIKCILGSGLLIVEQLDRICFV